MVNKKPESPINDEIITGRTINPSFLTLKPKEDNVSKTSDFNDIQRNYKDQTGSSDNEGIDTGTYFPQDMSVKLMRAENATLETFLSVLQSITLALFCLFLTTSLSNNSCFTPSMSSMIIIATICLGISFLAFLFWWIYLKIQQHKHSVKVPNDYYKTLTKTHQVPNG